MDMGLAEMDESPERQVLIDQADSHALVRDAVARFCAELIQGGGGIPSVDWLHGRLSRLIEDPFRDGRVAPDSQVAMMARHQIEQLASLVHDRVQRQSSN